MAAERAGLEAEAADSSQRQNAVADRVAAANAALTATEKTFADLTAALADLAARRTQLEQATREHGDRRTCNH